MPFLKLGLDHQNTMISNIMKTRSKINNNHWEYKYFTPKYIKIWSMICLEIWYHQIHCGKYTVVV